MSSTLTENVVLVRTRSHDLNSVKKLNCWGCTLKDVSIVNRMPNVEVISLSINSIDTLQYFSSCTMLQELYLRKNEIKNINEILHLSQLQFLKKLSLEDNPCANIENYRLTVLKALPNLEYLDNVKVTAEELYQAEKCGRELAWPGTELDDEEEEEDHEEEIDDEIREINNDPSIDVYGYHQHNSSATTVPANTAIHHVESNNLVNNNNAAMQNGSSTNDYQSGPYNVLSCSETILNPSTSSTPNNNNSNNNSNHGIRGQNVGTTSNHPYHQVNNTNSTPNSANAKTSKTNMAKANSLSDYNIYSTNGNFRCSSPALSGNTSYEQSMINEYYENGPTQMPSHHHQAGGQTTYFMPNNSNGNGNYRSSSSSTRGGGGPSTATQQQRNILPKGGKNRNANILSAVLCLIKELDYCSLEVVDTTIHCRMEEMED